MAVYQSALKLMYVDKFLERIRDLFAEHYSPRTYSYPTFEGHFKRELTKAEQRTEIRLKPKQPVAGNLVKRKVDLPKLVMTGYWESSQGKLNACSRFKRMASIS